jgi:hypothetical protein
LRHTRYLFAIFHGKEDLLELALAPSYHPVLLDVVYLVPTMAFRFHAINAMQAVS